MHLAAALVGASDSGVALLALARKITVSRDVPEACEHCGVGERGSDAGDRCSGYVVFSSGLLPFTVFGWPEKTPDLAAFLSYRNCW